jgi:UDP-3-O-[3-hydroxymyristoyl] N-acetylglucosamine deacetylase/3-hydroxyacyl-[acyl-carrier-protein] dehydratase
MNIRLSNENVSNGVTDFQCTIEDEVSLLGVGIHTGHEANVKFKPAEVDEGIVFKRVDLPGAPSVPANIDYVAGVVRGTTIQKGSAVVNTVEHLLATAVGLGVDNLLVEIDSDELPVGDGSAKIYTDALLDAGIKQQDKERKYFKPSKIISCRMGGTELVIIPADKFIISSTIHYENDVLNAQYLNIEINKDSYINEISSARTYCFESEIKNIQEWGLGKGGTFDNTIVIGETGITNTQLRFHDEFVRHKILDLIGDLYLLGMPLKANVIAVRSGHSSNIELAKKLKEDYLENETGNNEVVMDIDKLMRILPHRYPFLLVDRIEMHESHKIATGYKNITVNEPFFKGHFPENPVFPSALIIEFMAQSSAVMLLAKPELQNKLAYFIKLEKVDFFGEAKPLDMLRSKVELLRPRATGVKVRGLSYVGDKKIAEAEFMFALVDK